MLEALASLFTGGASAVLGGVVGTIGSLVSKWLEARERRRLMELEIEMKKLDQSHELAVMEREAASAERMAAIRMDEQRLVGDLKALKESIRSDSRGATWSAAWADRLDGWMGRVAGMLLVCVDVLRGMTRPLITYYLVVLTTGLAWWAGQQAEAVSLTDLHDLLSRIVDMVLFLTSVAVTWWFGTRPAARK